MLEAALDNLEFNENSELFTIFEFPENEQSRIGEDLIVEIEEFGNIESDDKDIFD